jgi:hypothetical protein
MIFIEFENKTPMDTNIKNWEPWSEDKWEEWKAESDQLVNKLKELNIAGKIEQRNKLIDDYGHHWRKLRPWLSAISHGKCWFSESRDNASHMEVEHFRPKKIAKNIDGSERDGYWWLSFDHTNFRLAGNAPNRKKGGWFPLHKNSNCSCFDIPCEESEVHYLLDPTKKGDVDLLAFDEEGKAIATPEDEMEPWDIDRVDESIIRLKLNDHDALPSARREIWQETTNEIRSFLAAKKRCTPNNPGAIQKMENHARRIRELTHPEAEFSAVARWCIFLRGDKRLLKLVW